MKKENFVAKNSIVREIWGKSDTILLIFAGASAEFALNKAVDWLFYTGRLPKDPLGRLFSTVAYAREIVFAEKDSAIKAIERINHIHASVENDRGKSIPDWAYRDVLFMLIDYSIRSYEILERSLSFSEKEEVFNVFLNVGKYMKLKDLPENFEDFMKVRRMHLKQHIYNGAFTRHLYLQYRKHLGIFRYRILLDTQILLIPEMARKELKLGKISILKPMIPLYKLTRYLKIDYFLKALILPSKYKSEISRLDHQPAFG